MTATVTPIGTQHQDGEPHLTDAGLVCYAGAGENAHYSVRPGYYLCTASGLFETCADNGLIPSAEPTVVITLHP